MIEHVAARPRRRDGDFEVFFDLVLADVFVKAARDASLNRIRNLRRFGARPT
jgi:hypothetical protein